MKKIILASQSPRRRQLLQWAEIPFDVQVKETDESYPEGLTPAEVAVHIARNKALAVASSFDDGQVVLAADTIVVLGGRIIGKPRDAQDAMEILSDLSGNRHQVITGVVIRRGKEEWSFSDITDVQFHALSRSDIQFYVDNYKPFDKAGAYAIQEWIGVVGIQSVTGDFYNVMGLPISRVTRLLREIQP